MEMNKEYSDYVEKKIESDDFQKSFWARVDKNGPGGCWLWTGTINDGTGCGTICVRDREDPIDASGRGRAKMISPHRLAWRLLKGKWPPRWALHECNVRNCVRPGKGHIYDGDHAASQEQRVKHGRSARQVGASNGRAKLSADDVRAIRERAKKGETISVIAADYGLSVRHTSGIIKREHWIPREKKPPEPKKVPKQPEQADRPRSEAQREASRNYFDPPQYSPGWWGRRK